MPSITSNRVRPLSVDDLGITTVDADTLALPTELDLETLPPENEILGQVRSAVEMGFAGVILSGPPGTGKSWYARRLAQTIAGAAETTEFVQFHASYQYEDFMEGFVPKDGGGFELQKKVFPSLCDEASEHPDTTYVLVIDEISRCDVARVFGEALTYLESDKRGLECRLASGSVLMVPPNLIVIATMNPWDKGVDEMDVALERRLAQIEMPPRPDVLRTLLLNQGGAPDFVERIVAFLEGVLRLDDEMTHLGHAYFTHCVDEASARRVWDFRLQPFFKKATRLDRSAMSNVKRLWSVAVPDERPAPQTVPEEGGEQAVRGDVVAQAAPAEAPATTPGNAGA